MQYTSELNLLRKPPRGSTQHIPGEAKTEDAAKPQNSISLSRARKKQITEREKEFTIHILTQLSFFTWQEEEEEEEREEDLRRSLRRPRRVQRRKEWPGRYYGASASSLLPRSQPARPRRDLCPPSIKWSSETPLVAISHTCHLYEDVGRQPLSTRRPSIREKPALPTAPRQYPFPYLENAKGNSITK